MSCGVGGRRFVVRFRVPLWNQAEPAEAYSPVLGDYYWNVSSPCPLPSRATEAAIESQIEALPRRYHPLHRVRAVNQNSCSASKTQQHITKAKQSNKKLGMQVN